MVEAPSCIEEFELDDDERRCYCQLVVRLVQGFRVDLDEAMRVANKNLVFGRREGRGGGLVDGGRHTSYRRHDGEWSGSWDDICNCQEGV
jgi:hypothetical protein